MVDGVGAEGVVLGHGGDQKGVGGAVEVGVDLFFGEEGLEGGDHALQGLTGTDGDTEAAVLAEVEEGEVAGFDEGIAANEGVDGAGGPGDTVAAEGGKGGEGVGGRGGGEDDAAALGGGIAGDTEEHGAVHGGLLEDFDFLNGDGLGDRGFGVEALFHDFSGGAGDAEDFDEGTVLDLGIGLEFQDRSFGVGGYREEEAEKEGLVHWGGYCLSELDMTLLRKLRWAKKKRTATGMMVTREAAMRRFHCAPNEASGAACLK